jgi:hypothetical protein
LDLNVRLASGLRAPLGWIVSREFSYVLRVQHSVAHFRFTIKLALQVKLPVPVKRPYKIGVLNIVSDARGKTIQ